MKTPFFSIIVVSLNAGLLISVTINSILRQTCDDYEIIIKDGKSSDDTLSYVPHDNKINLISKEDGSLYEAMNQAIYYSNGRYLIFMNCGDIFASDSVLENIKKKIGCHDSCMFYGDYVRDGVVRKQPSKLSKSYLYRTPLCHQTVFFYGEQLRNGYQYDTQYKILADYELELRLLEQGVGSHIDIVVCNYLGGGISESKKGITLKNQERKHILKCYYDTYERMKYGLIWNLSFPRIRGIIANSNIVFLRKMYHRVVNRINK